MLDSNVVIAYLDLMHSRHTSVRKRLQELYIDGAYFYYTQPVLLEVKNYWRLKLFTEAIRAHLELGKKLFNKFEKAFCDFEANNKGTYLKDWQLKNLRKTLELIHNGKGIDLWNTLCHQALGSKFSELLEFLDQSNFIYAKFNSEIYPMEMKNLWPVWENMDSIMEKFGLSSNDAAILNMATGAQKIDSFLTNDGDLIFAIAKQALPAHIKAFTFLDLKT